MLDEKEESYAQDAKWAVTHSPLVWGLIKHFCAHKLCTTVKVHSAVHYKSMQMLMRKKPVTLFEH